MDKFKIQEHLDWEDPEIWIESDDAEWDVTVSREEVEIEYDGSRERGRFTIPREKLKEVLDKLEGLK